ncbi:glycosyltransferase [Alkalimonas collagenimarina]|uniref:Glycosyltransferase n=1 Tax=Alkalimonas collagenimarina TaxID=400390 RepID=A0ABT9GZB0_9GAMM|nr:glycosyltransferase [Alkalimonas collagenimarina]MDP4536382.1 glycosyltransferase [Alkalimonas collagenimarina]
MAAKQASLLAITNLYPLPWAPHRASFNKQQFDLLAEHVSLRIMVLVPWREWLQHKKDYSKSSQATQQLCYVPYFQLPGFGRSLTPWFQRFAIARSKKWIEQSPPSHIIASWAFPDAIACLMYAKNKPVEVLVKTHGTDINEHTLYPKRRKIMARWLKEAKTIFCASQALATKVIELGIPSTQVYTNYNGVNSAIFYPEAQTTSSERLLFVGNLLETKGVFELIDAFIAIAETTPASLHFVGQGPAMAELQRKATAAGLSERIHLHGALPLTDVAEHIRQAAVVVLPSYREGVPNVLLEACACGVPVVATRVGGIPEVVTNETGILVDAKNSNALAEAISTALAKPWQKSAIVQHAARFNWQQNIKNFLARL